MARPAGDLSDEAAERAPVVFLSAGEPSGDMHGASLARALRARIPGIRLIGLGGPRMAAEGVELLADLDDLAVMGLVEILSRLRFFLALRRRVFATLDSERVDLVVPIDYPGFNLRLARRARSDGRKVLYYVAPQVWAWHESRAADLARDTDRIAVILPFEAAFLHERGASATFVGHPLLDEIEPPADRSAWMINEGLAPERPLLALMPGSRRQELDRHLALFIETAQQVMASRPETQVMIGAPSGMPDTAYRGVPFPVTRDFRGLLVHATAALVKSGTTTLETALAETPFVVAYRLNPISYRIARRMVKVPHIALANLVAEDRVVPEFIQDEASPETMSASLLPLLDVECAERRAMVTRLSEVRDRLGGGGAAARVAGMAADLLGVP